MSWKAMRTCLAALLALALAPRAHADPDKISIRTLSTHADRVSEAFAALDEDEKRSLASICRKLAA